MVGWLLRRPHLFFLHFVNRSGIPLTSFPNLECFFPAFTTAYEFRIWATRCLNWATVITVPALRPATSRLGDAGGDCRAPGGTGPEKLRLPPWRKWWKKKAREILDTAESMGCSRNFLWSATVSAGDAYRHLGRLRPKNLRPPPFRNGAKGKRRMCRSTTSMKLSVNFWEGRRP